MNSKVVSNTVPCAVAVVQAYLPQRPATQHLHVCTYTKNINQASCRINHPAAQIIANDGMVLINGDM